MKNVSAVLISVFVTFLASMVLGQLVAPKAMDREAVQKMLKEDPDKSAVQVELRHLNDGQARIEKKLDDLIIRISR